MLEQRIGDGTCESGENSESFSIIGDAEGRRERPVSVIGCVDLFSPNAEEKDDRLSSVSLYTFA